jgi:hypothetical protein
MTSTILATTFIAAVSALAVGLFASEARAEEGVRGVAPGQFFADCWIGMKWGDQPGQLIRGWICERPFIPAPKTDQLGGASGPPRALKEQEDVAAIGPVGVRR